MKRCNAYTPAQWMEYERTQNASGSTRDFENSQKERQRLQQIQEDMLKMKRELNLLKMKVTNLQIEITLKHQETCVGLEEYST